MGTLTLTELRMTACDRCCADYNVTTILPSGLVVKLCEHHYRQHEDALNAQGAQSSTRINDDYKITK